MQRRNSCLSLGAVICLSALAQTPENIPPDKLAVVSGMVTNSVSGEPVLRARVTLRSSINGSLGAYGTATNAEGRFSITQIPPGEYFVTTERPGFHQKEAVQFRLDAGQKKEDLKLALVPGGVITGRVVDADGEPVEGAFVSILDSAGEATDDRGRFRIGGLRPGHYRLTATPRTLPAAGPEIRTDGSTENNYAPTFYPSVLDERSAGRIVVTAGAETSGIEIRLIRVPIMRISGRVVGIPEGPTNRNWYVQVSTKSNRGNGAQVKPDGHFDAWRVTPGHYRLIALGSVGGVSLRTACVEVDVKGSNVEGVELHVVPPFDLTGVVQYDDDAARPTPNGTQNAPAQNRLDRLILQDLAGSQFGREFQANLKPDGTFTMPQVQPGRYSVHLGWGTAYIRAMQLGSRQMEGRVVDVTNGSAGEALTVVVNSGMAAISGVVRKGGDPAPREKIALAHVPPNGSKLQFAWSAADGSYKFEWLAPGTYKLVTMDREEPSNQSYQLDADDLPDGVEIRLMPWDKATRDLKAWSPDVQ